MSQNLARHEAIRALLDQIRTAAAEDDDPADFLQDLQIEIETLPGASVSFAGRDIGWLKQGSYLEDRPELSDADLQQAIVRASTEHEESYASQDGITYTMEGVLGQVAPIGVDPDISG